ncbi:MAG: hypothetical protein Q9177_005382, partial [Variospora cf. flavescens]
SGCVARDEFCIKGDLDRRTDTGGNTTTRIRSCDAVEDQLISGKPYLVQTSASNICVVIHDVRFEEAYTSI